MTRFARGSNTSQRTYSAPPAGAKLGYAVATAGGDLLAGAPYEDGTGSDKGRCQQRLAKEIVAKYLLHSRRAVLRQKVARVEKVTKWQVPEPRDLST